MRTLIVSALLVLASISARAELSFEITQGVTSPIPVAVVPFDGNLSAPESFSNIINNNLYRTGQFEILQPSEMLSRPAREDEIYYRDWRLLKQDYVVIGQVNYLTEEKKFSIRYKMYDVYRELNLLDGEITADSKSLRDAAHRISDRIYEKLTGLPGAFSTKIAYVTVDRKQSIHRLQIADADGHRAQVVFTSKQPIISPSWSPDGKRLAYVSFESGSSEVYVQDLQSGKRELLASFKGNNSAPAFSADGKKLALTLSRDGNPELYLYDFESKQFTRLTRHYGIDTEPSWMPDGRHLVFTSSRSGNPQLYKLDTETGSVMRLTREGSYNARGRVTTDGKYLIMVHRRNGEFHIASQDLRRGTVQILTTETRLDESPSVAPNGSMVIYAAKYNDRSILAAVSVDGQVKFRLPSKHGDVREPAWSPYL